MLFTSSLLLLQRCCLLLERAWDPHLAAASAQIAPAFTFSTSIGTSGMPMVCHHWLGLCWLSGSSKSLFNSLVSYGSAEAPAGFFPAWIHDSPSFEFSSGVHLQQLWVLATVLRVFSFSFSRLPLRVVWILLVP